MRTMAVIVLGVCLPMAGFSQGEQVEDQGVIGPRSNVTEPNLRQPNGRLYACPTLQALANEYRATRHHIEWLRQRYTQEHPDVQATSGRIAKLEALLAVERLKAASQGLDCSATEPKPERTETAAAEPAR